MSDIKKATELIKNTLKLLHLEDSQFEVTQGEESIVVQIDLPEELTGVYIGSHGDTITSLQLLLSLMVSGRMGEWTRVSLNVNDYRQKREQTLQELAENAATRATELNQEIIIPDLSSYERRLIHSYLSEKGLAKTESRGEGNNRQLFIIPSQEQPVETPSESQ